jgi:hypothetical protein
MYNNCYKIPVKTRDTAVTGTVLPRVPKLDTVPVPVTPVT